MRLVRRRRGTLEVSLTTLLESLVVAVLLFVLFFFGYRLYQAFFGANTEAVNTYHLMADNINSLVKSSVPEQQLQFRFTAHYRKEYTGTIFAIDSSRTITDPFPPMNGADRKAIDAAKSQVNTAYLQNAKCNDKPCLCFSQRALKATDGEQVILSILRNPTTCRPFDAPQGASVTFQVTPADTNLNLPSDVFPVVTVTKQIRGGDITIAIEMEAPRAAQTI